MFTPTSDSTAQIDEGGEAHLLIRGGYSVMTSASKTCKTSEAAFLGFIVLSLALVITAAASGSIAVRSESLSQARPTGCEYNTAILDGLAQKTKPNELIIVIAHLGPKDTKPNLNNRRLHNVRITLLSF